LEGLVYSRFDLKFVIKLTAWGFSRNVLVKCPMEDRTVLRKAATGGIGPDGGLRRIWMGNGTKPAYRSIEPR